MNLRYLACTLFIVAQVVFAFGLESGRRIAIGEAYGPLSCGLNNRPIGKARLSDGTDEAIFVHSGGFSSIHGIRVFQPIGTAKDGAPLFKLVGMATLDGNPFDKSVAGAVVQTDDGIIYGFWKKGKTILPTQFDSKTLNFTSVATPIPCDVRSSFAVLPEADGGFWFFFSESVGGPFKPQGPSHRNPEYRPFDGAGIWRGKWPYGYIKSRKLASINAGKFSEAQEASPTKKEFLLGISGLNAYRDSLGQPRLLAGGAFGIIAKYAIQKNGKLGSQSLIRGPDGLILRHPSIYASPIHYKGGMIVGGESALYYHPFKDRSDEEMLKTKPVVYVREKDANLYAGTLPVVNVYDWDADGLNDLIVGNSQGEVLFFKNTGRCGAPKFAEPRLIEAGGLPIRIQAGYWGVQGPGEARWGYAGPNVYDWNGDGLPDILMNDATSRHSLYLNNGKKGAPSLQSQQLLWCEGLEMHGTWRTRPAVGELGGRNAYITLDDDDALHLYWQIDARNLADGGKLTLENGSPITANFLPAGATGRAKLILTDIDKDGKKDLLVGTPRHGSFPDKKNGLPQRLGLPGAAVLFLKNIGSDNAPVFAPPQMMRFKGDLEKQRLTTFGQHECSADIADFGNDLRGFVVGDEEGRIWFFHEKDVVWESDPPATSSVANKKKKPLPTPNRL